MTKCTSRSISSPSRPRWPSWQPVPWRSWPVAADLPDRAPPSRQNTDPDIGRPHQGPAGLIARAAPSPHHLTLHILPNAQPREQGDRVRFPLLEMPRGWVRFVVSGTITATRGTGIGNSAKRSLLHWRCNMVGTLLSVLMLLSVIALDYYAYLCLQELRVISGKLGTPK